MKFRAAAAALVLLGGGSSSGIAQVALAARASTLGLGAELSFRVAPNVGIRLGGNYLQFSADRTIEDIQYHVTPHFENGTAILDLHPFGGPFHLSGGVVLNYNEGELVAVEEAVEVRPRSPGHRLASGGVVRVVAAEVDELRGVAGDGDLGPVLERNVKARAVT